MRLCLSRKNHSQVVDLPTAGTNFFKFRFNCAQQSLLRMVRTGFLCGYISLSSVFLRLFDQFILTISVKMRCVFNCNLRVSSFLTVDLLGLLKWRSQKDKLPTILPAVMKVSGEEIVKVFVQISFHMFKRSAVLQQVLIFKGPSVYITLR